MSYKGAILDLDNVLFPTSDYEKKVGRSVINSMVAAGLPASLDEGLERLMELRNKDPNSSNHLNLLCEGYGLLPAPQRIVQAGVSAYHAERERLLVPQPETNEFLDFLMQNYFRSCVVTLGIEPKQWFKLIRLGIVDYFLVKEDGRAAKELVYILENAKNKLQGKQDLVSRAISEAEIDTENSFVVDDRPYGIVAAKKAGIKYGFRLKRGKYAEENYELGIDDRLKHDAEFHSLYELAGFLRDIKLAK